MPDVSVIMAVHNDQDYLVDSMSSILSQEGVDLEFIVIDDGSTDESVSLLDDFARRDRRVKLIRQKQAGLTHSLILGCSLARASFMARQDADDISMPGRLCKQLELLKKNPTVAFVSCWSEMVGPKAEPLLIYKRPSSPVDATEMLVKGRSGPEHGSVMMRRDAYIAAGGYRPIFKYAQDSDLWLRLVNHGQIAYVPEVLFRYRIRGDSISGRLHSKKVPYARLIDELHLARQLGEDEGRILAAFDPAADEKRNCPEGDSTPDTEYFIGRCLMARRDPRALPYLFNAVRARPAWAKAWLATGAALFASPFWKPEGQPLR